MPSSLIHHLLLLAIGPTPPPDPTHSATQSFPSSKEPETLSHGSHWMRNSPNSLTQPLPFPDSASPVTSGGVKHFMVLAMLVVASSSMVPFLLQLASLKLSSPQPPSIHTSGTKLVRYFTHITPIKLIKFLFLLLGLHVLLCVLEGCSMLLTPTHQIIVKFLFYTLWVFMFCSVYLGCSMLLCYTHSSNYSKVKKILCGSNGFFFGDVYCVNEGYWS